MVRHPLHRHRRPRLKLPDKSLLSVASSSAKAPSRRNEEEEEESSTETLPAVIVTPKSASRRPGGDGSFNDDIDGNIDFKQIHRELGIVISDEPSTLSNEASSIHFANNNEADAAVSVSDLRSNDASAYEKNRARQIKDANSSFIDGARKIPLFDAASSRASSSHFATLQRDSSRVSNSSSHIRRQRSQSSQQSRQAWRAARSHRSSLQFLSELDHEDDESWMGSSVQPSISPKQQSRQSITRNRRATMVATIGNDITNKPSSACQVSLVAKRGAMASANLAAMGLSLDEDEQEWSDVASADLYRTVSSARSAAGDYQQQASDVRSNPSPAASSIPSASSSAAVVHKQWKYQRRLVRRNAHWNTEDDWCTESDNEDWPGASPRSRTVPPTIPEVLEDDMSISSTRESLDQRPPRTTRSNTSKRSFFQRFFSCS